MRHAARRRAVRMLAMSIPPEPEVRLVAGHLADRLGSSRRETRIAHRTSVEPPRNLIRSQARGHLDKPPSFPHLKPQITQGTVRHPRAPLPLLEHRTKIAPWRPLPAMPIRSQRSRTFSARPAGPLSALPARSPSATTLEPLFASAAPSPPTTAATPTLALAHALVRRRHAAARHPAVPRQTPRPSLPAPRRPRRPRLPRRCGRFGHGVHDAATDPAAVRALFAAAPWATGYGIACGLAPHHLIGVDLDTNTGRTAVAALRTASPRTPVHAPADGHGAHPQRRPPPLADRPARPRPVPNSAGRSPPASTSAAPAATSSAPARSPPTAPTASRPAHPAPPPPPRAPS